MINERRSTGADRGTTTSRGYGSAHQKQRDRWRPLVDRGAVCCWRCHQPILPGTPWDAGHDDHDRSVYRGPEHATCNRSAGAAEGHRIKARLAALRYRPQRPHPGLRRQP
jgi:hypothetical protein